MSAREFGDLLNRLALAVLLGGWALGVLAFFVIGTETCTEVAGAVRVCQGTTPNAVILLTVIGFGATVGSLFLWAFRHVLEVLSDIEENTKARG
jgi:hypothetical protein